MIHTDGKQTVANGRASGDRAQRMIDGMVSRSERRAIAKRMAQVRHRPIVRGSR